LTTGVRLNNKNATKAQKLKGSLKI